jgi:DNA-binding transcriptional MerR regulator
MHRHLSPAETAKRFGTSIKALRLYEKHGLLKPLRTSNGATGAAWRVYGPDQIARLLQILALKRLGLSLAQIGELLLGDDAMDRVLAFQERALVADGARITRALALIRKAQAKLASGDALSIDDLATLTQETVMTKLPTSEELKEITAPFRRKHLTPEESASLEQWRSGQAELVNAIKQLTEEAKTWMASGDASSAAAMEFARRFRAKAKEVESSNPSLVKAQGPKWKAMWEDVRSDPEASRKMAPMPEVMDFIRKLMANLKAAESAGGG